jgi:hypothetical protein
MNRNEFKILNEEWNKFLEGKTPYREYLVEEKEKGGYYKPFDPLKHKSYPDNYPLSDRPDRRSNFQSIGNTVNIFDNAEDCFKDSDNAEEIKNTVWAIVKLLDPTPITGVVDLYESAKKFKNERTLSNALDCLWNGITLVPGMNFVRKLKEAKKLKTLTTILDGVATIDKAQNYLEAMSGIDKHVFNQKAQDRTCPDKSVESAINVLKSRTNNQGRIIINKNSDIVTKYYGNKEFSAIKLQQKNLNEDLKANPRNYPKLFKGIELGNKESSEKTSSLHRANVTHFTDVAKQQQLIDNSITLRDIKSLAISINKYTLSKLHSDLKPKMRKERLTYIRKLNKLAKKIEKLSNNKIKFDEARRIINRNYWTRSHLSKRRLEKIRKRIVKKLNKIINPI